MIGEEIRYDSYRDPDGYIFRHDGRILRAIRAAYEATYLKVHTSGLAPRLLDDGLLIPAIETDMPAGVGNDVVRCIAPREVPVLSYPWEWSFEQLRDAALATLRIQKLALSHGLSLKDASSLNIQFVDGRPLLIDTLSFEPYVENSPWVAYRQFCEQFLAPLAIGSFVDPRLIATLSATGGSVTLDLAARMIGWKALLRPGIMLHVSLQSTFQRRAGDSSRRDSAHHSSLSRRGLESLIDSLERTVSSLPAPSPTIGWSTYDSSATSGTAYLETKTYLVEMIIRHLRPSTVWDLGCNTGMFSTIAAAAGAEVVALDQDHASIQQLYRSARSGGMNTILPLVVDIALPTPATGWLNREYRSLFDRGERDLCLALALVHHLAIGKNLPFRNIIDLFPKLSANLLIEFIPKNDRNVRTMLSGRADVFPEYTQEHFEAALGGRFDIREVFPIGESGRSLYLCKRKELAGG